MGKEYKQLASGAGRGRLRLEYAGEGDEISAVMEPVAHPVKVHPRRVLVERSGADGRFGSILAVLYEPIQYCS